MISEKSVKDQSLDLIYQDLAAYISSLSPQKLNENCLDFCLPQHKMDLPQSIDLPNQAVFEGEKTASLDFTNDTEKVKLAESECGSSASRLPSRQSSLIEEWFGNISNTHPNDISVDSSLEALFASIEWPDLNVKVEMPTSTESSVTENCLTDASVFHSADNIPAAETVACEIPVCSGVCTTETVAVPENVEECSSQPAEGILRVYLSACTSFYCSALNATWSSHDKAVRPSHTWIVTKQSSADILIP